MANLILIRGLPGSGKSTMAKEYVEKGYVHFEADMYFVDERGNYLYDKSKIRDAHLWCQAKTKYHLEVLQDDVVVSNTFVKKWELKPYLALNADIVKIITANGRYANIHGVPDEVISRMESNWESFVI